MVETSRTRLNAYQKTAILTVMAVLFLILIGSLVRASGAGLGCPDWPKCWGCWWPPSDVSEIDASRYDITSFNKLKMWIEYVNRLLGVLIGFFITATSLLSFRYRKSKPRIFWASLLAFVLVLFQGWLGAQVVRSQLEGGAITVHMIVAILILLILIYAAYEANHAHLNLSLPREVTKPLRITALVILAITISQMVLGTRVREQIDHLSKTNEQAPREQWLSKTGASDHIHRSFSWVVLGACVFTLTLRKEHKLHGLTGKLIILNAVFVALQIGCGIVLAYGGLPATFQILHLTLASVMITTQFLLLLIGRTATLTQAEAVPPH